MGFYALSVTDSVWSSCPSIDDIERHCVTGTKEIDVEYAGTDHVVTLSLHPGEISLQDEALVHGSAANGGDQTH